MKLVCPILGLIISGLVTPIFSVLGDEPRPMPKGEPSTTKERDETREKAETAVRKLILAARSFEKDEGLGALQGMNDTAKLYRQLGALGKEHPEIVVPIVAKRLFHSSEFVRIYLMESLLEMKEASAAAYPYVKELRSVDIEPGPVFRYQRWLQMDGVKPVEIPLEVKVEALSFSAQNRDAFLRTAAKEMELINLGKDNRERLETLLKPLLDDENLDVAKAANNVLDGIR